MIYCKFFHLENLMAHKLCFDLDKSTPKILQKLAIGNLFDKINNFAVLLFLQKNRKF